MTDSPSGAGTSAVAPDLRYGTGMVREFGWLYRLLGFGRTLGRIRLSESSVERIRQAAATGPIVYVLPRHSAIDLLALNTVLHARGLPLAAWSNGNRTWIWEPLAAGWAELVARTRALWREGRAPDAVTSGWVARNLVRERPIAVFNDTPEPWGEPPPDPFGAVFDAQDQTERSVQVLPIVVLWDRAPERQRGEVQQFVLGNAPMPGTIADLRDAWWRSREASIQVGEPIDLAAFRLRIPAPRRIPTLRALLRRQLRRETELVRGPRLLPYREMQQIVLDNPPMRELVRSEAAAQGQSEERVRKKMIRDYRAIAANFRWWVIRLLHLVLRPLWTRVFSGVDTRPEDLERIRAAMRRGSAVLVPSHKSHFDYVLLSWVFYENDLIVPHVVAGNNLAIWPISIFLRGAGGFFVKRSFGGERIFPAVFARYLRELVLQGYPVEFFIEGGRTRSGKLMPPKIGVLGMVLDAAAVRPRGQEVTLLPVAFAYEQVAEEGAYAAELGGQPKKPESLGQFVQARSVLRRRYGRVYLRIGEPIACSPLVDPTPSGAAFADKPWADRPRNANKETLNRAGELLVHRIGEVTVLLPTSLVACALLAHHRRGIRQSELSARIGRLRGLLQRSGIEESAAMTWFDQSIAQALDRFVRAGRISAMEHDGQRVWSIVPEQRIYLEFYKNQVLHRFATAGLAACAIRALPDAAFDRAAPRAPFAFLLWLMRREFVFDPDRSATELLRDGLDALVSLGALAETDAGQLRVADPERMGEIFGLMRSLVEGYAVVLRSEHRIEIAADAKALTKALMADAGALLAAGAISRPESLSLVTLQNAIATLTEDRVIRAQDGRLVADSARRAAFAARIAPMVD